MKSCNSNDGPARMGGPLLIFLSALALAASQASAQTAPTLTTLYSFRGSDGAAPAADLIADAAGNLYGTTTDGGANGYGTVFKVTPTGTLTTLYSFSDSDGAFPFAGLIADAAGNLYGTTQFGGAHSAGTVFELAQDNGTWTETVLYSFQGQPDGAYPLAGLIADAAGNLYGATAGGGDANGDGTMFKLTQDNGTWTETVLYSFTSGSSDGANPQAGLIADAAGNLYGATAGGGDANGDGTVFEVTPTGTLTTLYSFTGGSDGADPKAGLIFDSAGNLYGTTAHGGGANNAGTVFKVTPTGTETVLYSFTGGSDGAEPRAGLIADAAGNLYGTTHSGPNHYGTVFKLQVPGAAFNGVPGQPNCNGQNLSFLAKQYGGLAHAARSLGYSSVSALKNHVTGYCGGS